MGPSTPLIGLVSSWLTATAASAESQPLPCFEGWQPGFRGVPPSHTTAVPVDGPLLVPVSLHRWSDAATGDPFGVFEVEVEGSDGPIAGQHSFVPYPVQDSWFADDAAWLLVWTPEREFSPDSSVRLRMRVDNATISNCPPEDQRAPIDDTIEFDIGSTRLADLDPTPSDLGVELLEVRVASQGCCPDEDSDACVRNGQCWQCWTHQVHLQAVIRGSVLPEPYFYRSVLPLHDARAPATPIEPDVDGALARSHPLEQLDEYCYEVAAVGIVDGQRHPAEPACASATAVVPLVTAADLVRVPAGTCDYTSELSQNVWLEVDYQKDAETVPFDGDDFVDPDELSEERGGCSIGGGSGLGLLVVLAGGWRRRRRTATSRPV